MHCHQPKNYFRLNRSNYDQNKRSQSFNTHDDRNKRPRFEDNTNPGGAGRGYQNTLLAWLTRQKDGHNQQNSYQSNHYQPNTPHNLHNSHNSHNLHNSHTLHNTRNQHNQQQEGGSGDNYQHTSHKNSSSQEKDDKRSTGMSWKFTTQRIVLVNSQLRKMPISSDNNLPHLSILLGKVRLEWSLSVLYDTDAALTSGYIPYHLKIRGKYPHLVHIFEVFDGNNPFDPIKLLGAIGSVSNYDPEKYGMLSAGIRYFTPCRNTNNQPLLFPVALGEAMVVNTILGNTVIREWKLVLDFDPPLIKSTTLKEKFDVVYERTRRTSTQLTHSHMDPTSASIAQEATLRAVSSEEQTSISNAVLDKSWGQHR